MSLSHRDYTVGSGEDGDLLLFTLKTHAKANASSFRGKETNKKLPA